MYARAACSMNGVQVVLLFTDKFLLLFQGIKREIYGGVLVLLIPQCENIIHRKQILLCFLVLFLFTTFIH